MSCHFLETTTTTTNTKKKQRNNRINNVFEMLLHCLCVYVVHFKLVLQISVCESAKIPGFSAHTASKHVAALAEALSGNSA
jgi:hypothetical protein